MTQWVTFISERLTTEGRRRRGEVTHIIMEEKQYFLGFQSQHTDN